MVCERRHFALRFAVFYRTKDGLLQSKRPHSRKTEGNTLNVNKLKPKQESMAVNAAITLFKAKPLLTIKKQYNKKLIYGKDEKQLEKHHRGVADKLS